MSDAFGVRHRPAASRCESWPRRLDRKVIQGTRSEKGLENHGVRRSLLETAKRQGKKARNFLLELFTKDPALAQAALHRNPLLKPNRRSVLRC